MRNERGPGNESQARGLRGRRVERRGKDDHHGDTGGAARGRSLLRRR